MFAIAFADKSQFYVMGIVGPGGEAPPAAMSFTRAGQCMLKGTTVADVYLGTMPLKPSREASN